MVNCPSCGNELETLDKKNLDKAREMKKGIEVDI